MKILMTNYYPLNTGGAEVSTYLIAKGLERIGYDVIFASTGKYKGFKTYILKKFRLLPFYIQNQYLLK